MNPDEPSLRIPSWARAIGGVVLTIGLVLAAAIVSFAFDTTSRLARMETHLLTTRASDAEARSAMLDVVRALGLRVDRLESRLDDLLIHPSAAARTPP